MRDSSSRPVYDFIAGEWASLHDVRLPIRFAQLRAGRCGMHCLALLAMLRQPGMVVDSALMSQTCCIDRLRTCTMGWRVKPFF